MFWNFVVHRASQRIHNECSRSATICTAELQRNLRATGQNPIDILTRQHPVRLDIYDSYTTTGTTVAGNNIFTLYLIVFYCIILYLRLRFGEFLADNIVRFINLFTYLLTYFVRTVWACVLPCLNKRILID